MYKYIIFIFIYNIISFFQHCRLFSFITLPSCLKPLNKSFKSKHYRLRPSSTIYLSIKIKQIKTREIFSKHQLFTINFGSPHYFKKYLHKISN